MARKTRGRGEARVASSMAMPGDGLAASDVGGGKGMATSGSRQETGGGWPAWARVAVSVVLVYHLAAVLVGAMAAPPSSELERAIADGFMPYFDVMDLGYSYRFYSEPGPTPVVTATILYEDGRPEETVRLPDRDLAGPRMRHQRQLALANSLNGDVQGTRRRVKDASQSPLARAYARHLCLTRPGCRSVMIELQQHLIPDPADVRQALSSPGAPRFDLFAERLFSTPEWIGDYPCDDF